MSQVLTDLKNTPGVLGAILADPQRGLLAGDPPSGFGDESLAEAGRTLAKIFATGRRGLPATKDLALHYLEMLVVVREVRAEVCLVVFCEPSLNLSLLDMTLGAMADELVAVARAVPAAPAAAPQAAPTAAPAASTVAPSGWTVETVRADKLLGPPVAAMEKALNRFLGPMATILLDEAIESWLAAYRPGRDTLPRLAEFAAKQIGDPAKEREFKTMLLGAS